MGLLEDRITLTAKMFANVKDVDGKEQDKVNKDIQIVFQEGANPRTNGRTVYLPTGMNEERLWVLLGALLHECFHIRFTEMGSLPSDFKENNSLFHVLNALEDMRINWKSMKLFPKTKLFFHALYLFIAQSKKSDLLEEPMCFQIIKTLLFSNDDFPVYSDKAVELIKLHNLNRFQEIARNADSVTDLFKPARELYQILKDLSAKDMEDMGESELAKFLSEMKKALEDKLKSIDDEYRDTAKKLKKEWKRLHRKMATNKTRSRNLDSEANDLDAEADEAMRNNQPKQASELRSKANHKQNLSDAAHQRGDEADQ